MTTNRHLHHRRDGIAVICTRRWCAPSRAREIAWRVLFFGAPIGVVAAGIALGPRRLGLALALFAIAAYVAWGTQALGGRIERAGGARARPRERATSPRTGSAA